MNRSRVTWDGFVSLDIPSSWESESDGEIISVFDPDGSGALQFSFALVSDSACLNIDEFASSFAKEQHLHDFSPQRVLVSGAGASYIEGIAQGLDESFWRIWHVGRNGRVVTISYTCEVGDIDHERSTIDDVLGSIEWLF